MTLAEQIRPLLSKRDPQAIEALSNLALDYQAHCRALNDRLARCSDYLRRGLRSEAVHLAECHPSVLRTVEDLVPSDDENLERVFDVLGLVTPVEPDGTMLSEIRSACELEQSLAALLSQHRTLAVGRGPLPQRLAVLRALAKKDSGNRVWQEDIRLLESERIKGIEREYKAAIAKPDATALQQLWQEVSQTAWSRPPSKELVARIQKSALTSRRQQRIRLLRELLTDMRAGRAAGDQAQCATKLDEWERLTTVAEVRDLDLPVDLLGEGSELVHATGAWLASERRRSLNGAASTRTPLRPPAQPAMGRAPTGAAVAGYIMPANSLWSRIKAVIRKMMPNRARPMDMPEAPQLRVPAYVRGNGTAEHHV